MEIWLDYVVCVASVVTSMIGHILICAIRIDYSDMMISQSVFAVYVASLTLCIGGFVTC